MKVYALTALVLALPALRSQGLSTGALPLDPRTHEVVEQLGKLRSLEADDWKYHPGDLPHGEDVNLDDLSWQSADRRGTAPTEVIWYRRWFEMPKTLNGYDLTDSQVYFQFHADASGPLTQIVYFNGRRVALGEGLEPIILFDHARPGERILVAVK
jgi:alpha-mannosidase